MAGCIEAMGTHLVATVLLLNRRGIDKNDLVEQVEK
jgi:hypothetical protein